MPEIIPVLLGLLTRQDEDADEDEWNVSMAAATCLSLLAQTVADAIVPAVIPFIEANIKSQDWHQREAAVMTFGSILDGPDPTVLTPLVTQALPILLEMTRDENLLVKDTVAWTLGRICDLLVSALKPDVHLHPLVSALVNSLDEKPRIVANCCWALMNLSDQLGTFYDGDETVAATGGPLAPYYEGIVTALLKVTDGYVLKASEPGLLLIRLFTGPETKQTIAHQHMRRSRHMLPMLVHSQSQSCRTSHSQSCHAWNICSGYRTSCWAVTTETIGTTCRAIFAVS